MARRLPYKHSPAPEEGEQPWTIHIQLRATAEEIVAAADDLAHARGVLPLEEGREELRPLEDA
jgi:hypothetical protein